MSLRRSTDKRPKVKLSDKKKSSSIHRLTGKLGSSSGSTDQIPTGCFTVCVKKGEGIIANSENVFVELRVGNKHRKPAHIHKYDPVVFVRCKTKKEKVPDPEWNETFILNIYEEKSVNEKLNIKLKPDRWMEPAIGKSSTSLHTYLEKEVEEWLDFGENGKLLISVHFKALGGTTDSYREYILKELDSLEKDFSESFSDDEDDSSFEAKLRRADKASAESNPKLLSGKGSLIGGIAESVEQFYKVEGVLGTGNYAEVKKATNKKTGKEVALKYMEKSSFIKDATKLQREVGIMTKISHPNVVKMYDVFESKEHIILVLEYVSGGELFDRIVELGHYTEKTAIRLVKDMCRAVGYLHSQGVVHRDLKPENLLLSSGEANAVIKIADFGLSRFFTEATLTTACGTPGYIAPEVLLANSSGYEPVVDIWAIGIIAYILLCGFPPFYSDDDQELFRLTIEAKLQFPRPHWSKTSETAKDFIKNALAKSPEKRFTADQCLQHEWLSEEYDSSPDLLTDVIDSLKTDKLYQLHKLKDKLHNMFSSRTSSKKSLRDSDDNPGFEVI